MFARWVHGVAMYHLLQDIHALFELRALQLQRLQAVLQRRDGRALRVLLLPLPLAGPLVRPPVAGCSSSVVCLRVSLRWRALTTAATLMRDCWLRWSLASAWQHLQHLYRAG